MAVICTALTVVVVARVLGPEHTGYYAAAATLLFAATVVGSLGLPSAGAQRIANDPAVAGEAWVAVTLVRLGVVAILAGVASIVIAVIPMLPALRALLTLMLVVWTTIPFRGEWWLVATGRIVAVAVIRAVSAGTTLAVAAVILRNESDGSRLIFILASTPTIAAVLSTALVLRARPTGASLFRGAHLRAIGNYVRAGISYLSADVSVFVNNNSDRLFLLPLGGPVALGLYDAAYKLIQPLSAISPVVSDTYFLRLARTRGTLEQGRIESRYVDLMLVPTVPFGFFCALFADEIVRTVYGPAFAAGAPLLAILGWSITLGFLSGTVAIPFTAWNAPRAYAKSVTTGSITNLLLNVLLIPRWLGIGAAIATVAAKLSIVVAGWRDRKRLSSYPLASHFVWLCLVALLSSGVALATRAVLGPWPAMVGFAVTYVALAVVGRPLIASSAVLVLGRRQRGSS